MGGGEQDILVAVIAGGSPGRRRYLPKVTAREGGGAQTLLQVSSSQSTASSFTPTSPALCAFRTQTLRAQSDTLRPGVVFLRQTAPWG